MNAYLENFHQNSGEILRLASAVESSLEYFISNYFCDPQSYKTFVLQDKVILLLGFGRKICLFKEICKEEGIEQKEIKGIAKAADFVRDIRNRVAHGQTMINDYKVGIILQKKGSTLYKQNE